MVSPPSITTNHLSTPVSKSQSGLKVRLIIVLIPLHRSICEVAVGDTKAKIDRRLASNGVDGNKFVAVIAVRRELESAN